MPATVREIDVSNAGDYLRVRMGIRPVSVSALPGGVSNTVLLVEADRERLVIKQSLPKLRVQEDWFCDRSRIFRESAAMRMLAPLLPQGSIPQIVFEDAENYLYAMTAAPDGSETWKDRLMRGGVEVETARQAGRLLGMMIRMTFNDAAFKASFGDLTAFDQLRLDPYYRSTANRHPEVRSHFEMLINECRTNCVSLVHGDWSPKNFLVTPISLMAIDWECVHFGNPAFDAAFVMNHLLLKSFLLPHLHDELREAAEQLRESLEREMPLLPGFESSVMAHLAGLLLARIDGKSPAEYIRDPDQKNRIRSYALDLIRNPAANVADVFRRSAAWR